VAEANYEIRIKGRLSDALLPAFEGMAVTTEPAETTVYGALADQASVRELLAKLESLGLEVVEFRRLPEPGDDPGAAASASP
jgi:hypothetical protein